MAEKKYKKALFIFRRDLRLNDNKGLRAALSESQIVIPCFILDLRQVGKANAYRSANAIQFMIESLEDLASQLAAKKGRLYIFHGNAQDVVKKLIKNQKVDAVFFNRDYTPFSIARDKAIQKACAAHDVPCIESPDALLNEPEDVKTGSGKPYSIYTPFYKYCAKHCPVEKPFSLRLNNFYSKSIPLAETPKSIFKKILPHENKDLHVHGGSHNGQKILHGLKKFKNYLKERDIPALEATTNLSAHLKFGSVSVREVADAIKHHLGPHHPLIRQLYWRDFFYHIAFHTPSVFGHAYHKKYDRLWWSKSKADFKKWCNGETGFPIVDAGMRQLNETGYMHNRLRMIVASFLTKDLHINWQWGEKYFAQQLVDYDPAINNGNWQWSASTGADAQPYFRIFNPWTQQKKFDPHCAYIKRWVPQLANIDPKIIHNWFKETSPAIKGYPRPMVDHDAERKTALKAYKAA
jgi:deoxyribodipyrimidine photo-lyase